MYERVCGEKVGVYLMWNYRIIKYCNGGGYGLHEVYYDKETGEPESRTEEPCHFFCWEDEGPTGIIKSLQMALDGALSTPVLDDFVPTSDPRQPIFPGDWIEGGK